MLRLENVRKKFNLEAGFFARAGRYVYAVNGVTMEIRDGETYGLVGESGCGKTTLARLMVGMYPLDGGEIRYTDRQGREFDLVGLDRRSLKVLRSRIKYIFQDPARSLNPRMTVLGVLTAGYRYSPSWPGWKQARREAQAILEEVGLSGTDLGRRPADFSGGQRQRIAIARALISRPELLICDEVVSALDVSIQSQILTLLLRLKQEHRLSMLFIAHDLAVVSYISDRVGVMYGGRLVEEAPSEELTRDRAHPYTRHLYASIPILARSGAAAGVRPPDSEPMASASRPLVGASASRAERGASAPMASTPTALESQAPAAQPQAPEPAACPVHGDSCPEERVGLRRIGMEHFIQCQG